MPITLSSLTDLGLDVMLELVLAYFVLITLASLTALCARSNERRSDALAVLQTLLLRNTGKGRR